MQNFYLKAQFSETNYAVQINANKNNKKSKEKTIFYTRKVNLHFISSDVLAKSEEKPSHFQNKKPK